MSNPETNRGAIQAHPLELRERAYEMFANRTSLPEIAESIAVPLSTVQKWSSKGKWKARLAATGNGTAVGGAANNRSGETTSADIDAQLARLVALPFAEKQQAYLDIMATESLRAALSIQNVPHAALVQNADKVKKLDEVARKALRIEENKPMVVVNVGLLAQPSAGAQAVTLTAAHVLPTLEAPSLVRDTGIASADEKDADFEQKLAVVSLQ